MADVAQDASEPSLAKPDDMPSYRASRPTSPDKEKLRGFISYSRDDLRFADQLDAALNACGFESVIDRHGISVGEDWKRRLGSLISGSERSAFMTRLGSARYTHRSPPPLWSNAGSINVPETSN